jgi:hypothetical protein
LESNLLIKDSKRLKILSHLFVDNPWHPFRPAASTLVQLPWCISALFHPGKFNLPGRLAVSLERLIGALGMAIMVLGQAQPLVYSAVTFFGMAYAIFSVAS